MTDYLKILLTAFPTSKHKNFPIVRHFLKDLLESSHGFSARASFIIMENHRSGKVLRHSGGKCPARWQEKSVSVAKLIRFMNVYRSMHKSAICNKFFNYFANEHAF